MENAEIKPIYKKGNKTDSGNYKPVNLTIVILKVYKRGVRDKLHEYFINNDHASDHQFSSSMDKSYVLLKYWNCAIGPEEWMRIIDSNNIVGVVFPRPAKDVQ